jgi:DnaA family protein
MIPAQLPLRIRLRDSSVFESYFAGRNRPVVDALLAIELSAPPTCIWLQGPRSSGKTHLLQASCVRWSEREGSAYLPLRDLSGDAELLSGYGQLAFVAIDDVEVAAGQGDWERALFRLHQELDERGGHLLLASVSTPAARGFKLRDLASRLNGGLVLTLQPLDEQEQIRALQLRAQLRGFELPEDTVQYLQRRLPRDMTSLCAFLDELDEASLAAQRKLTVPFVREIVERAR